MFLKAILSVLSVAVSTLVFANTRVSLHGQPWDDSYSLHSAMDDEQWLEELRWEFLSHEDLQIHVKPTKSHQKIVHFSLFGEPICRAMLRVTSTQHQRVVLGTWPTAVSVDAFEWDHIENVHDFLRYQNVEISREREAEMCWFSEGDVFFPVWKVKIYEDGFPKEVLANQERIFFKNNLFFSVQGTVRALKNGLRNQETRDVRVELLGNTHLESEHIYTTTTPVEKAVSAEHQFLYGLEDPKLAEATSFVGVYESYKFFQSFGYEWHLPKQRLHLILHQDVVIGGQGYKNQAVYDPEQVVIQVADGDGVSLEHLPYETDVAAHEFGHHVVYEYLTSAVHREEQGQTENLEHSGAIHEGLADYFHAAHDNDPCFGGSLCKEEGESCYVVGQCMRTLDNAIAYDTNLYWSLPGPHLKSQLLSGMLWDIRKQEAVVDAEWDQVVYSAIEFLPTKAVYHDVIVALAAADLMHYEGKHLCVMTETAIARGFQAIISQEIPDCKNYRSEVLQAKKNLESINDGDGSVKTKYCGVVGYPMAIQYHGFWFFLPFIILGLQMLLRSIYRRGSCDFAFSRSRSRDNRNNRPHP